jgi:hypothetical protein
MELTADVHRPTRARVHSQYSAGVVVWVRWPGVVQVRVPGVPPVTVQPGTCLAWWSRRQGSVVLGYVCHQ